MLVDWMIDKEEANGKRFVKPDHNAWLVPDFIAACKNFENEFGLSLWEALLEYVSYHNPYCAYLGRSYEGEVELYPLLEYNHELRRATLKKIFFISKQVKTIFTHDYLEEGSKNPNATPFFNLLNKNIAEKYEEYPELEFMVVHNNIEPSYAKEILMRISFYRRSVKRLFVLENEAVGIDYNSSNIVAIDFDLSFLKECRFLYAKRYSNFEELLPKNLIMTVSCKLDFVLPEIPKQLRRQQLLDLSDVNN
ncbi:hypothetical protein [Candidatus Mycoplasma haematohominis]|uniref:hypothetical protein n=1 Tax=Candidatus Mycoplasma haematohominis TaxID=1494318 RepID=UPI001C0A6FB9|nr:hypothetical protein [Candidatus Mycoplasma haemohominis]